LSAQASCPSLNLTRRPPGPQRVARNKVNCFAYCFAASHHAVAVRKFNEATVHLSSRENAARLALAVLSVLSVDVREVLHLRVPWLEVNGRGLSWLNDEGIWAPAKPRRSGASAFFWGRGRLDSGPAKHHQRDRVASFRAASTSKPLERRTGRRVRTCQAAPRAREPSLSLQTEGKSDT
jgi:hypothetical protein